MLVDTFTKVAAYWRAKNVADAVTFAETARDVAKVIADGQGDKAANLMKLRLPHGTPRRRTGQSHFQIGCTMPPAEESRNRMTPNGRQSGQPAMELGSVHCKRA